MEPIAMADYLALAEPHYEGRCDAEACPFCRADAEAARVEAAGQAVKKAWARAKAREKAGLPPLVVTPPSAAFLAMVDAARG